jgi:hypothetical protein
MTALHSCGVGRPEAGNRFMAAIAIGYGDSESTVTPEGDRAALQVDGTGLVGDLRLLLLVRRRQLEPNRATISGIRSGLQRRLVWF